ncbi:hypothetical protein B0J13DRAFT_577548 [Dactylonectria estremocensis]|uniref:Uncharacterized protein n=1 Tax=Dactylonectria estremocensis TaxID=1079267 RepID=A0A9P9I8G1_9HYPO|nr:hypothetical protein B0J13DRAFT_577548 [Dactylonectria estremocensis]
MVVLYRATQHLMRRCDQLSDRYNADVYIVVRRNHRHYDYNSTNDALFPTPLVEIEQAYPLAIRTPLPLTSSPVTRQRD